MHTIMSINISPTAQQQIIKLLTEAKKDLQQSGLQQTPFIRLGVQPGGCSGMTYKAMIDTEHFPDDKALWTHNENQVFADEGSSMFLQDISIDYSSDLIKEGFVIKNKAAKKSCGCGGSFAL